MAALPGINHTPCLLRTIFLIDNSKTRVNIQELFVLGISFFFLGGGGEILCFQSTPSGLILQTHGLPDA